MRRIRNKQKKITWGVISLVTIVVVAGFVLANSFDIFSFLNRPQPLQVIFFDVGQGDAILIKTPNRQTILIDGGPDNKVLRRLGENLPFWQRRIDFMIFSHYHDDHITGLIEILKRYRVRNISFAPTAYSSPILQAFLGASAAVKIVPQEIAAAARLNFGANCFLDLLNPEFLGISKDENNSLYARLDCAGQTFLFTGDSGTKADQALITSGWPLPADVLKASHHGSNSANSEEFLRAVNPRLLIISVGADNKFGHPTPTVLERADALGLEVKRTDQIGTIKIIKEP